jgi:hypothetical protein
LEIRSAEFGVRMGDWFKVQFDDEDEKEDEDERLFDVSG